MVVQVALDVDKRGVALSARVRRPVSFVSQGLMILPNGLLMIRKLTAKNIFHSIGEIVATHPAGWPSWQNSFVSTQKLVLPSLGWKSNIKACSNHPELRPRFDKC